MRGDRHWPCRSEPPRSVPALRTVPAEPNRGHDEIHRADPECGLVPAAASGARALISGAGGTGGPAECGGQPRGVSGVPPWSAATLSSLAAKGITGTYACVTPSDACGLGRASGAATPASPSSRAKWPGCHDRRSACGSQATGKFASANFRTTGLLRGFRACLARPQGTAPEGDNAGIGPATRLGSER